MIKRLLNYWRGGTPKQEQWTDFASLRKAIEIISKARIEVVLEHGVDVPEWGILYRAQRHLYHQEKAAFDAAMGKETK